MIPAPWQKFMPHYIDRWKSSPAVRAMRPDARSGYHELLTAGWQSPDCTIPTAPVQLADISGLGDELWATHGERILRNFVTVTGADGSARLRNLANYELWLEAVRIHNARTHGAYETNGKRSPKGQQTVSESSENSQRPVSDRPAPGQRSVSERPSRGKRPPNGSSTNSQRRTGTGTSFTKTVTSSSPSSGRVNAKDKTWHAAILQALLPVGITDTDAATNIITTCQTENAAVTLDEIIFWIVNLLQKDYNIM